MNKLNKLLEEGFNIKNNEVGRWCKFQLYPC